MFLVELLKVTEVAPNDPATWPDLFSAAGIGVTLPVAR